MRNFSRVTKGKIKYQLYAVYWFAVFIPVLVIGAYLVLNTRNLLYKQDYSNLESDNLRVKSIMLDVTNLIYTVGNTFLGDIELQQVIGKEYNTEAEAYEAYRNYRKFEVYKRNYIEISRIELYSNTITEYGCFLDSTSAIKNEEWYKKALSTPQPVWTSINYKNNLGIMESELRLVQRIPIIKTGEYAVLVISINNNHLKSRVNNNTLVNDIVVNEDVVFYSESGIKGTFLHANIDYETSYYQYSGRTTYNDKDVLLKVSTLKPVFSSDRIYILTSDPVAIPHIRSITNICFIIISLSIFFPFIMVIAFTHRFNKRIMTLREVMHHVSLGDYIIKETIQGDDELTDVFKDLQVMIQSIIRMDEEIYSAKIKQEQLYSHQQRIKYEMLASQINPHFLYNTLETIRMKALSVEDKEVANAIKLLGKSMRHVLDNSLRTVSLYSELEYIKMYLGIQHIRFGDRIRYDIQIEDSIDCKNYYILPLLLQPIVENAVSHGIETQTGYGKLEITIMYEDDKLVICVSDDGQGMTEEELEKLIIHMKKEKLSTGRNIGLHNIYQRIRLFYGNEYGISIVSGINKGTKVSIYLPKYSNESVDLDEALYNRI